MATGPDDVRFQGTERTRHTVRLKSLFDPSATSSGNLTGEVLERIASALGRASAELQRRGYTIGLPMKWFNHGWPKASSPAHRRHTDGDEKAPPVRTGPSGVGV